jgi:hypothetical protein
MNKITLESLAQWIEDIKEAAKDDTSFSIAWFKETENKPFSIVAGWTEGAFEDYSNIFCVSKSEPKYVMALKIAINEGPYAYTDFDAMSIPLDKNGEVDSACIPLEWNDSPEAAAQFFLMEWERIMEEHGEEL